MMAQGLQITLALSPRRGKKGLIEYLPIEIAPEPVKGENSLFINCVWVLPPFWKKGIAKELMQRFLKEAKEYGGATVLAYEGDKWFGFFDYMPVSFFRKFGFEEASRDETRVLLHLDLGAHKSPMLIPPKNLVRSKKGEILLDAFCNRQCPWSGWMVDRIKRNMRKYSGVTLNIINTDRRDVIEKYGMSRGIRINGEPVIKRMAAWEEIESTLNRFTKRNVHS